ncbi:OB-fold domain-containing protein [Pseudonocardia sp. DSM 110487]|uniref:Zn-ribbon domain-containing OB-fold protein n=1 Tax=Pseudonocardia sp. DSM 110487 TaxID=2865833 RepID=UPI001C69F1A8|nr:OB-fold domain-containing protein [Pseudonocardia sp. DSM 110487]QYN39046.1 OB-fold domain-containing protein [Pseudonocardia sp. DSM 110487]
MTNTSIRLVDDSLFTDTPQGVALLGSRCMDCSAYTFPRQGGCPRCTGSAMEDVPLSRTGTLWSWTVQGFRPKAPYSGSERYEPYGVGYVELPGQLIVEARLTETDPERLAIGMPMVLELVPFCDDPDGVPAYTFAFVAGDSDV